MTVQTLGGARIENIVEKADHRFPEKRQYDIIYTFVGVNNLTIKWYEGKVIPVYDNVPELIETLTDAYIKLKSDLKLRARKIVVCQIVGIDIDEYNKYLSEGYWYYQQNVINSAMPILLHTINLINRDDEFKSPWITGSVHNYVNRKQYNRYANLRDGLHPHKATKVKWAKLFTNSIIENAG